MIVTQTAPNCFIVAPTGWDTCGYDWHVRSFFAARYREIEPEGYLVGQHDHVAQFYSKRRMIAA